MLGSRDRKPERRIRLAALPVGRCDMIVLERDPANRERESGWFPASAVSVEIGQLQLGHEGGSI
jgi:hypothetical protein